MRHEALVEPRVYSPADLLGPLNEVEKKYAPAQLFVHGDITLLRRTPRVAVIGSRNASEIGLRRAKKLARFLADRGAVVVSGLAKGIDAAAHRAAIEDAGQTIGVIGTPLNRAYPKENADLQELIAAKHLLVSQFPIGARTGPWSFPVRNRTMALLANASVIVEAGNSSGSLSQGWETLRLGRPLFFMKGLLDSPGITWPAEMQRYGAQVLVEPEQLEEFIPEANFAEYAAAGF
jgi:DNA processing protein